MGLGLVLRVSGRVWIPFFGFRIFGFRDIETIQIFLILGSGSVRFFPGFSEFFRVISEFFKFFRIFKFRFGFGSSFWVGSDLVRVFRVGSDLGLGFEIKVSGLGVAVAQTQMMEVTAVILLPPEATSARFNQSIFC